MNNDTRLRAILALLLVATAVLFAIGTAIERSQRNSHTENASSSATAGRSTGSTGEAGGGESGGEQPGSTEATHKTEVKGEAGQKLLGIDTESVGAMIAAVAVSLAPLAAAVWFRRERWWLWLTLAFGVVFAVGDTRELIHQVNESRTGVAVIAAILIAAHLLIAGLAGLLASRQSPTTSVVAPDTAM
jgi:hypothetical protein